MKKIICLILLGLFLVGTRSEASAYFGQVEINLSPGTKTVNVGEEFDVRVMFDTTNKVSFYHLKLDYNEAVLEVVDVNINSSNFNTPLQEEALNGFVFLSGAATKKSSDLVSGNYEAGTIRFKALREGSSTISMASSNVAGYNPAPTPTSGYLDSELSVVFESASYSVGNPVGPNGTNGILNFKVAFDRINSEGKCADNWPIQVMVRTKQGVSKTYSGDKVHLTKVGFSGRSLVYRGSVLLEGISELTDLSVFIKGPKHIQTKYGRNNQAEFYNKAEGFISVTKELSSPVYDFSRFPLLGGDVTGETRDVPDGVIDGRDFSYIKTMAINRNHRVDDGGYLQADLDGDCWVGNLDVVNLMIALQERQEQLY